MVVRTTARREQRGERNHAGTTEQCLVSLSRAIIEAWSSVYILRGKLVHGGDFPHLLVYGPSGAGKKTRIMCVLRELYGAGVERLRIEHQNFVTPSKKKIEIVTVASNYHIEVNPR
ncbi:hypothetical protein V5799_021519 [Amblyomma americanum]|uniref:Uncharacterized protein n=1 Tax=Amblyomma americanum TaxID=6943 RepID=A0AAQ4FN25_AMBAM